MRTWTSFCCILLSVTVLASTAIALASGGLTPERQSALLHLVRHDCGSCHGMTMRGGLGLPLRPADLADFAPGQIADVIMDGVPGTPMPPWRDELTREEAIWIAQQLKKGLSE